MTHTDKKTALNQGVIIFIFLAVLTALEFFIAIAMDAVALLVIVALVKAGLVVYYYMHIYKLNAEDEGDENSYAYKTGSNRLGLWLFLLSDSFVFGGLLVSRLNLLGTYTSASESNTWLDRDRRAAHLLVLHEPGRNFYGEW